MGQVAGSDTDIMIISDVAIATGLNKSTVSRIVKAHPDLVHGKKGRSILISKTAFNIIRSQNTNMAKSGNHAGLVSGELPLSEDVPPIEGDNGGVLRSGSALNDARTRTEIAKADRAEMDLKIRQGELVEMSSVQKQLFDAFRTLRDELRAYPARTSVDLASISDQREVKKYQTEAMEAMLSRLSTTISEMNKK